MDLFTFINEMVEKPSEFKKTKLHERGKHFFMINRLCSIKYPIQASYFNHIKIHPGQGVTFWQGLLASQYKRTPGWMYVKTKKEKEKKKAAQPVSDETIIKYCAIHQVSRKTVDAAIRMFDDKMWNELENFDNLINQ